MSSPVQVKGQKRRSSDQLSRQLRRRWSTVAAAAIVVSAAVIGA
jgi:hypothetical protein